MKPRPESGFWRIELLRNAALVSSLLGLALTGALVVGAFPRSTVPAVAEAAQGDSPPTFGPISTMADAYGALFPAPPLPDGLSPTEAVQYALHERPVQGRTPMEWIAWANANYNLQVRNPAVGLRSVDLASSVARLYAAAGADLSAADRVSVDLAAANVPLGLRAPFARLVSVVADAYEDQGPIVDDLMRRAQTGFDLRQGFLAPADRETMARNAARIVAEINSFRALADSMPLLTEGAPCPIFQDPKSLVILGGDCNDVWGNGPDPLFPDPILLVDVAGNDTYENSAAGANPTGIFVPGWTALVPTPNGNNIAVSVLADLDGGDDYTYDGEPSVVQGSGSIGGMGILVDVQGDDVYYAKMTRTTAGPPLIRGAGLGYWDGGAQGHGYVGLGLLLDGLGDDVYQFDFASDGRCIWALAQGFGGGGGLGVSSDGDGSDDWLSNGLGLASDDNCWGPAGGGPAFQGLYTQGVGLYAGVGIMTDTGADDDVYYSYNTATAADYYAQGFGAFGGLGILYEDGGMDDYIASETATDTVINPLLNCAYGTGSIGGVGVMVEQGGNDHYFAETISDKGAETMVQGDGAPIPAYGIFVDLDGVDVHEAYADAGPGQFELVSGRGVLDFGHNLAGTFLDLGGDTDTYIPSNRGSNNNQWAFGADR